MPDEKIQPYLTSENGELFDLSLHHGDVTFQVYDLTQTQVLQLVSDIKNMLALLTSMNGDTLKERNERILSGGWII